MADVCRSSIELGGVEMESPVDSKVDPLDLAESGEAGTCQDENAEFDPWALPQFTNLGPAWSELNTWGKVRRVVVTMTKIVVLVGLLYMFICSLDFLGNAFRLLGGKAAGEAFSSNKILSNPIAGLMIGILGTVLVQSSSTTTSVVVAMVASDILAVEPAIPMVMGANIGTSVTNTLVSLAQAAERNEFRRAFAGAVVHDIFNWLSVLIFLPLEVVSHFLLRLTGWLVKTLPLEANQVTKKEFLKALTKPFTGVIIKLDKKIIQDIALGDVSAESKSLIESTCNKETVQKIISTVNMVNETKLDPQTGENITVSVGYAMNVTRNVTVSDPCTFLFADTGLSDTEVGIILLIIALVILCICLVCIVKLLHSMLRGQLASIIRKTVNSEFPGPFRHLTGYVAILIGAGMTILVQSSSIFTSALTPLIGVGVVSLERAFPLTLGANIGTTGTGILAALASDPLSLANALQIAFCHLFFNICGILVWYPIPCMRRVPIQFAKTLGNKTADYRWFAVAYLVFGFFLLPASVFGLSLAGWQILLAVAAPIVVLFLFVVIVNVLQSRVPTALPKVLRDWEWAPKWTRSLEPHDRVMVKVYEVGRGRCGDTRSTEASNQDTT